MPVLLKILLIISLISVPAKIISLVVTSGGLFSGVILLVISGIIFAILWQITKYAANNPEDQSHPIRAQVARWVSLLYLSITAMQLAVLVSFVLRFVVDTLLVAGYYPIWSIINFLITTLVLYLIARSLKFSKPIIPAITATILLGVITVLSSLLSS